MGGRLASANNRDDRRRFVERIVDIIPVEDYGLPATDAHAELIAHVRRAGEKKSAHDLQIAATARVSGRTVVTTDRRAGFDRLPGVDCIVV